MAVDTVNSEVGVDKNGNPYTKAISNDKLTNEDFLQLMLQELKLQDPTKPMDSTQMMDSQLQMSTLETNMATIDAMKSLQSSFAQTALSSASNIIGQIIETGEMSEAGVQKQFKVNSVEIINGTLYMQGHQIVGYNEETGELLYKAEPDFIEYNKITRVMNGSV
ncbi:flagellar hook assembly protein FlgD [Candidatus Marinarcus aquaticus]|uniref:Basal-body rod modification protein FlgD n=1 Tax=Candidatus Marinarcus aquaticus TaxID=2044504 RepID=A0A4Q0XRY6_9BACT|nr:flagellar hook capping FlgD N-terminal domain-containing protein [Candidatus Marinarcus aquaticus]RXJ56253.1 hypothetical protein CRV04_09415 [Candidatus Marinarcus aquaticus]